MMRAKNMTMVGIGLVVCGGVVGGFLWSQLPSHHERAVPNRESQQTKAAFGSESDLRSVWLPVPDSNQCAPLPPCP